MATPEAQTVHRAAQGAVLAGLANAVRNALGLWVPGSEKSVQQVEKAAYALVSHYAQASSAVSLQHYRDQRVMSGVPGRPPALKLAPLPPAEQVDVNVRWSLAGPDPEVRLESAVERLALNAGRESMVGFTNQDSKARGWARVPRPDACAFCRMLGTRGAVYKSADTAGRTAANAGFTGDGLFKFHDNCHCTVEPLFGAAYEPVAHVRADQELWAEATKGHTGQDAINAFRRAVYAQQHPPKNKGD